MDLVILPHHNTLTSLQKLQAEVRRFLADERNDHSSGVFLPSYPLVCTLAHTDELSAEDKQLRKQLDALKDSLSNAGGTVSFLDVQAAPSTEGRKIILPVSVPFMDVLQAAGFAPVETPHFVLGTLPGQPTPDRALPADTSSIPYEALSAEQAALPDKAYEAFRACVPAAARVFRLALMQTTPLSGSSPVSDDAFSWKFHHPFWVKLR